jgi:hypothetical protein
MSAADQGERLERIAAEDPTLAAKLVLLTLPAASASIGKPLDYELTVEGVGARRVTVGGAEGDDVDFRITTDARAIRHGHRQGEAVRPHAAGQAADPGQAAQGDQAARAVGRGRVDGRRRAGRRRVRPGRDLPLVAVSSSTRSGRAGIGSRSATT